MKRTLIAAAALAFVWCGCASRVADFTIASTKTIALNRIDLKTAALTRNVEATDGRLWFLIIPLNAKPRIKEAMDRCLEKGSGDYMANAVVYEEGWSLLLFSWGAYTVKGDVGNSLASPPPVLHQERRVP